MKEMKGQGNPRAFDSYFKQMSFEVLPFYVRQAKLGETSLLVADRRNPLRARASYQTRQGVRRQAF